MTELLVAVVTFLCLTVGAFAALYVSLREPFKRLRDDTIETVSLVANIFVVMTSLVLGLMMYSAKNTLETANHNVHALARDIILLDRIARALGPDADETRRHLLEYLQESLNGRGNVIEEDPRAEAILDATGTSLGAIRVSGAGRGPASDNRPSCCPGRAASAMAPRFFRRIRRDTRCK